MGTMSYLLPATVTADLARELERACVAGGYDNMPFPTRVRVHQGQLILQRDVDESGYLVAPWQIDGFGRLMGTSATLIERPDPYRFAIELARGKVNQLRCQTADWKMVGLQVPDDLDAAILAASRQFGRAITRPTPAEADAEAQAALTAGYQSADRLVRLYTEQIFEARCQRQPRLDSALACRLNGLPPPAVEGQFAATFNTTVAPLTWKSVEPTESQYRLDEADEQLGWADRQGLRVSAGPLIDFSTYGLPDWLWLWEGDLPSLASFMCDYVETAVGRYRNRVRRWQLTAASNNAMVLKLGEDDLLWLTARLAEAALNVDHDLELVIGVSQPWGEYMGREEHTYSPFIFADTLIRHGLKLSALDLEWLPGVMPRGSYCRDLLDASRMLDLYALLGVPVQVTLAYPSSKAPESLAEPSLKVGGGYWRSGVSPEVQAEWAASFATAALCKPFVRAAYWAHLNDGVTHQFPHCGLLDAAGQPKPAFDQLRALRDRYLK